MYDSNQKELNNYLTIENFVKWLENKSKDEIVGDTSSASYNPVANYLNENNNYSLSFVFGDKVIVLQQLSDKEFDYTSVSVEPKLWIGYILNALYLIHLGKEVTPKDVLSEIKFLEVPMRHGNLMAIELYNRDESIYNFYQESY